MNKNKKILSGIIIGASILSVNPLFVNAEMKDIISKENQVTNESTKDAFHEHYVILRQEFHNDLLKGDFTSIDKRIKGYLGDVDYLSSNKNSEYYSNIDIYKLKIQVLEQLKREYKILLDSEKNISTNIDLSKIDLKIDEKNINTRELKDLYDIDKIYQKLNDKEKRLVREMRGEIMFTGGSKYFNMFEGGYKMDLVKEDLGIYEAIFNKKLDNNFNKEVQIQINTLNNIIKEYIRTTDKTNDDEIIIEDKEKRLNQDTLDKTTLNQEYIKQRNAIIAEYRNNILKLRKDFINEKNKYKQEMITKRLNELQPKLEKDLFLLEDRFNGNKLTKYNDEKDTKSLQLLERHTTKYKNDFANKIGKNIERLTDDKLEEIYKLSNKLKERYQSNFNKDKGNERNIIGLAQITGLVYLLDLEIKSRENGDDINVILNMINQR